MSGQLPLFTVRIFNAPHNISVPPPPHHSTVLSHHHMLLPDPLHRSVPTAVTLAFCALIRLAFRFRVPVLLVSCCTVRHLLMRPPRHVSFFVHDSPGPWSTSTLFSSPTVKPAPPLYFRGQPRFICGSSIWGQRRFICGSSIWGQWRFIFGSSLWRQRRFIYDLTMVLGLELGLVVIERVRVFIVG